MIAAEVENRGRYWRVRIGPFKTRGKADVYRAKFEEEERMKDVQNNEDSDLVVNEALKKLMQLKQLKREISLKIGRVI